MHREPIVITGIGLIASTGRTREAVWQAVQEGRSGVRRLTGVPGLPDGTMLGATCDVTPEIPGELRAVTLAKIAAAEALHDSRVNLADVDRTRFGCAISGHMGDMAGWFAAAGQGHLLGHREVPAYEQWLPNTACTQIAMRYRLGGPLACHSTACASGLIGVLSAVRAIRDGRSDVALAGGGDAINPLFAAGFQKMKVMADAEDPTQACRPFDSRRKGFVLGEGGAVFVIERLGHALARGAKIYAEITAGKMLAEAHHVTGLDSDSDALARLISETLRASDLEPADVGYINAHGTGTQQNDLAETTGIRRALGSAADRVQVSSTKSMLGHLINAAGSTELAITLLGMRDGFAPPTINLTDPDPACDLDCLPLVGRTNRFVHALKLSIAFGGHLVAVGLRRWNDAASGFAYPEVRRAA